MKKAKRYLSVCLTILLLVLLVSPASASFVEGTDLSLTPMEMNDLMARTAITTYFAQRESFLQGETTELPIGYAPLVRDEAKHLEAIQASGYALVSSTVTVENTDCWDYTAQVTATETMVYQIDESTQIFTVSHLILVYITTTGEHLVTSDGYLDSAVNFTSASYIPPDPHGLHTTIPSDTGLPILNVALQEVGEKEDTAGNTKYHDFFNYSNGEKWCAMFVTWCAYQAEICTTVIPWADAVSTLKDHMQETGRYYLSKSQDPNTTFVPQAGDLFFQTGETFANHVGLVVSVEGNYVWVVDGNWGDQVSYRRMPLDETGLLGFGRPQYESSAHSYPLTWQKNNTSHWKTCLICSYVDNHGHTFVQATPTSPNICKVCGYQTSIGGGVIMSLKMVIK